MGCEKQTLELLSAVRPDRLSPELERLLRSGALAAVEKRDPWLHAGLAPDSVFCVESGAVQLSATSGQRLGEAVLGVAGTGAMVWRADFVHQCAPGA